jgi:hypothetical protein
LKKRGRVLGRREALNCAKGGYTYMRHDAVKGLLKDLLREGGFKDVRVEPGLLPMPEEMKRTTTSGQAVSTDSDEARLDLTAMGFWSPLQRAYFDVRVTNPLAPSYASTPIQQHLRNQEGEKKRAYNTRILEVEHASFSPLVFTVAGGSAPECEAFLKRLAAAIAKRSGESPAAVIHGIRSRLSFTLLRSNTVSLRGSREPTRSFLQAPQLDAFEFEIEQAEARAADF